MREPEEATTAPAGRNVSGFGSAVRAWMLIAAAAASMRVALEPVVRSVRRRLTFAVVIGLLSFAAISFGLVSLTLLLATWLGLVGATAAVAVALAGVAFILNYWSRLAPRSR